MYTCSLVGSVMWVSVKWFHCCDRSEDFARCEGLAYCRDVYEDDVAQLALCEVGDADYGRVALDAAPLVVVRVFQICWYVHGVVIV